MSEKLDYQEKIPNNVRLSSDKRLQRALEAWQPRYLEWWHDMGPADYEGNEVYLRTAISVDKDGWAHFGHVRMPEYRWGIFLAEPVSGRRVPCGDHFGDPAWQQVPGEYRNDLKRLIVTQADTEPASVEQQRLLGHTAPSLYDLRNLFQVNVEEGRHLWAMVYILHTYFGKDGRGEAEELLERRSGNPDRPRILTTFNEPIETWLDFFMFTMFTDRDGKYQLLALAESGFDPLSRTCRFMLTEEAHHMFVGQTGIGRVIQRTCEVLNEHPDSDPREHGAFDFPTIQRFINFWSSSSNDLFGSEISTNAANFFAEGIKGRANEERFEDHVAREGVFAIERPAGRGLAREEVPLRNAMNEVLREDYIADNQKGIDYWNRIVEKNGFDFRFRLPHKRFHRTIGLYAGGHFDLDGNPMEEAEWNRRAGEWLPTGEDRAFVKGLMQPVREPGRIAGWIAPPSKGINGNPFDFEYVRL